MSAVTKRESARLDLVEHYMYLAENASADVADRFLRNAEATFKDLAQQPKLGSPLTLKHPDLAAIRKWRIQGFDNHLVFYQPQPDGVAVVRVLHAASNWWSLLGLVNDQSEPPQKLRTAPKPL